MSSWPGSARTLLSCSYFQCLQISVFFINGKDWTRRNLSAQNRRRGRKEERKKETEGRREEKRTEGRWEGREGRRKRKGREKKEEEIRVERKKVRH